VFLFETRRRYDFNKVLVSVFSARCDLQRGLFTAVLNLPPLMANKI
jgi:hypothetical protein